MRLKFRSITSGLTPLTSPKVPNKSADREEKGAIVGQGIRTSTEVKAKKTEAAATTEEDAAKDSRTSSNKNRSQVMLRKVTVL